MDHPLDEEGEEPHFRPNWLQRVLHFVLGLFCCGWGEEVGAGEHEHVPSDNASSGGARRASQLRSRPLQEVGENSALLHSSSGDCCHTSKMSPQEKQFKSMQKPSFTTKESQLKSVDDESCLICLEDFTDDNPKTHLACGHGFHLGCMLEWQERGRNYCPLCDLTVGSLDEA